MRLCAGPAEKPAQRRCGRDHLRRHVARYGYSNGHQFGPRWQCGYYGNGDIHFAATDPDPGSVSRTDHSHPFAPDAASGVSMETAREKKRRGSALIEFSITFIPLLFLTMSIVGIAVNMWEFHSLDYAVDSTTRYVTFHGQGCSQNGDSCTITVATIISYFEAQAFGADATQVTLTLRDGSGTTTCNPITSCSSSTAQFQCFLQISRLGRHARRELLR